MKFLIVTGIFPPDIGGPASYVPVMARALAERGHKVRVLTTSEPEHLSHDDGVYPFPVVRINRRLSLWRRTLSCITQIMRWGGQAEVIYANGVFPETALANLRLRKPLVMKIVIDEAWQRATNKGWTKAGFDEFQSRQADIKINTLKRVRSWYAKSAHAIITPSGHLKRTLENWGVSGEKISVVYNALDPQPQTATEMRAAPDAISIDSDHVRLITVGRLIPLKGVYRIIRQLPRLDGVRLTVVGEGPCAEAWSTLAREHGVSERVRFTGAMPQAELPAILRAHDVFVLASDHEGLPWVILEAMTEGLPVVATRVGGIPEIVEHECNGILVETDDESLYQGLKRVICDPTLRRRLAEQALQTVQTKFSINTMIDQTEKVLVKSGTASTRESRH